ncbi:MAG: ABC transporter permease [Candidatus Omnitrophica bacterium]|nr:ABC transporter permease [Candidatus Omnitrophota bacterium]
MFIGLKNFITHLGRIILFLVDMLGCIVRGRVRVGEVFKQIYAQGIQSLAIVMATSFASGAVLAMQSRVAMERFGAKELIASLVALSLVRELSPVFTALVFSGKSGAGMTAELGTMSVNSQILATRTMGVDPMEFLIVPRFLACMIVLPILVVVSEVVGIFGGWLIAVTEAGVPSSYYIHQTLDAIRYVDFFSGFVKVFFFALLIGWVSCYKGFYTSGGSMGVGRFTTQAVANCYIAVIVSNTILTKAILTFWGN